MPQVTIRGDFGNPAWLARLELEIDPQHQPLAVVTQQTGRLRHIRVAGQRSRSNHAL